jgi:hypothetical protein
MQTTAGGVVQDFSRLNLGNLSKQPSLQTLLQAMTLLGITRVSFVDSNRQKPIRLVL